MNQKRKKRKVAIAKSETYKSILKQLKEYLTSQYNNDNAPEYITGYIKKRNILNNATPHINKRVIVKADIKDFFYSIKKAQIKQVFIKLGANEEIANILSQITTYQSILYPGLITSPIISNLLLKDMDQDFFNSSKSQNVQYTRYADDLTFSSNEVVFSKDDISKIVAKYGFRLNDKKFIVMEKGHKQIVTGLSVDDKLKPRIPRKIKIRLKTACYLRYRLTTDEYKERVTWCTSEHLNGLLNYYNQIEPEFITKMRKLIKNGH